MQIKSLTRKFIYKKDSEDIELADPNSTMSVDEVLSFYSGTYPELNNAVVIGPKIKGDVAEYKLKLTVGTKG